MQRVIQIVSNNVADAGAVVSGSAWGVAYFAGLNEILTTIALIIAIASGLISLYQHLFKDKDK